MPRLSCPHCGQPVQANPIGRWYAGFLCPHCRGKLRFTGLTNSLGIASSAFFFATIWALAMGRAPVGYWVAAGTGAACILLTAASYALRRIEKA